MFASMHKHLPCVQTASEGPGKYLCNETNMYDPNYSLMRQTIFFLLVCVDALHPSQQFFSHVGAFSGLPGLNKY